MQTKDQSFLGTEPVGKLLVRLAVPTVIAQLVNMLYNIVDRIYIGHIAEIGSLALTGVGVCMPIIMIVTAFAALVASGGAPRASIALGRGDHDTAEKLLGGSFSLQIAISLLLTAVLLLFGHNFLLAFGASENTIEYADSYLNIYALGTLFVELTLGMNAFITAQGFATTGMLTVLIGAVCNIVLDPLFIFGLNMGVRGAALATVLSQGISCVWVVSFLMGKKTSLRLKPQNMRIDMKLLAPCIALGLSTFIMQSTESIISVCFNSSLLKYGGDIAVGAMTILTSVMQFAMLPLQGLAQGAQPISSYNFGAKNAERQADIFRPAQSQSDLFRDSLGLHHALPAGFRGHFHAGSGAAGLHGESASHLLRRAVHLRHSDCLPDDLCFDRQRAVLHHRSHPSQICAADSADLHSAAHSAGSDDGCLYRRAGRRYAGRDLHDGDVRHAV